MYLTYITNLKALLAIMRSFKYIQLCYFQGFVSAVSHMRSFVPAVYDVTVAIPKSSPSPTMLRLFQGQPSVVSYFLFKNFIYSFLSFFLNHIIYKTIFLSFPLLIINQYKF